MKKIAISELRLGMYVSKLGGSWLKHPFWKGSFLLRDPKDLAAILASGIQEVWISPDKGLLEPEQTPEVNTRTETPAINSDSHKPRQQCHRVADEIQRARQICLAAKNQVVDMFADARLGKAVDPQATVPLVRDIADSVLRQPAALISVARLKTHDDYTYLHSVAVCALMLSLAHQLGLDEEQAMLAGMAGLMHDLGKAAIPLEVLNKPGKLSDAEFTLMKQHPEAGARLLRLGGAAPQVHDVALLHHEKVDGSGYPQGLVGENIPLLARMGAICDVYDAVTSERPYKKAWEPAIAIRHTPYAIRQMATWDGHFDKAIFNAFVKCVGIYPVGSLVQLESRRLAVVVEPGSRSLLTPVVKVFYSLRSKAHIPVQSIDLASAHCQDRIVGPEDPEQWNFTRLTDFWLI